MSTIETFDLSMTNSYSMGMDSFALIIFGITGNLAQSKLIPALYDMVAKGALPKDTIILGIARKPMLRDAFITYIQQAVIKEKDHRHQIDTAVLAQLTKQFRYVDGEVQDPNLYLELAQILENNDEGKPACNNRMYYLATYPDLYTTIFEQLEKSGLNRKQHGWVRLMIEKPFGHDLKSAKELNRQLGKYFSEDQIYRLDHYLGKETLQNILTFRFGNGTFEPLMNKEHIDHIQITSSEDFGIGNRGGYYDQVGALKDIGQNHLLQMLAFATMDAPEAFTNQSVTHKRLNVLRRLMPLPDSLVQGQYHGYKSEPNVGEHSSTATFFAFKTYIDLDHFRHVPIYIRGGKNLTTSAAEISIVFKTPHNRLFGHLKGGQEPNVLIYRVQPNEAIVLKILAKKPGSATELQSTYMQFCYRHLESDLPDPYENLLLDAMRGEQTFFTDAAEIEAQWAFIDELLRPKSIVHQYDPGSWGPHQAQQLIERDGRAWLEPSMAYCQI